MTDSLFRPFETHLDRKSAREVLKSTLIGAEDGELFLERCRSEVLSFDDGRLRRSSFEASEGFGLRAVQGERVGYAHSTEISEQAMRRSAGTVRLAIQASGGTLCAAPPATADIAGLALSVLFHDYRDIHAHHWAIVRNIWPLGAQDHHFLMGGGDGGRNLHNAAVQAAGISINFA